MEDITQNRRGILFDENIQLGPFPMHRLKHVDRPTTVVTDNVQRVSLQNEGYLKARRGEYGQAVQRAALAHFFPERYPLTLAQLDVLRNIASVRGEAIAATKAPVPEDPIILSRHIKRLAYFLGADIVGICRVPKYAIYSHDAEGNPIDIDYENAIVLVRQKEYTTLTAANSTDWINSAVSFAEYVPLATTAEVIAGYIKKLGYPASPQSMVGGMPGEEGWFQALMMPLLLWAGIGEVSRTHMILNPFIGLTIKASAVLTDMPLEPDKPIDFGLQDFCQHCNICAEACPAKAISFGDKAMYNGYETWKIDERRCMSYLLLQKKGTMCETCVEVCPWTRPNTWPHNLVRWANRHSGLARKLAIKGARILGHPKPNEKEKWWFDMTYVDGVLKIPPKKE